MTFDDVRVAITGALDTYWTAAHPGIPIEYQNFTRVDMNEQKTPFLSVKINIRSARQANLSNTPGTRYDGEVLVYVFVRAGEGTKDAWLYADEIAKLLAFKKLGNVQMHESRPLPGVDTAQWHAIPVATGLHFYI